MSYGYTKDWHENRERPIDRYRNHNDHEFWIGGDICSRHFNIYITDFRVFSAPERDISFQSVAGRNGDIAFDNRRMKNIDIVYSCAIPTNFDENFSSFKKRLYRLSGYQKIVDTATPGMFRMGIAHKGIDASVIRRGMGGTFDVCITCKPQKFLEHGTFASTFTAPAVIRNDDYGIARPIITVYGTGPGNLTIGGVTVRILALTDQITLDCDLMTAYRQVGNAGAENKNGDIYAPDFPVLGYGENAINWDGGITHIELIPRWWSV